jgi:hypothetical protein
MESPRRESIANRFGGENHATFQSVTVSDGNLQKIIKNAKLRSYVLKREAEFDEVHGDLVKVATKIRR